MEIIYTFVILWQDEQFQKDYYVSGFSIFAHCTPSVIALYDPRFSYRLLDGYEYKQKIRVKEKACSTREREISLSKRILANGGKTANIFGFHPIQNSKLLNSYELLSCSQIQL